MKLLLTGFFPLAGTKSDLWEQRCVLFEEACSLAEKHGLLAVLETSAKESRNISEVFLLMARELVARNSPQACADSVPSSVPHSSTSIILAQELSEKTHCTC